MSCVKLLLKLRSNEGAVDRFLDLQLADNRHRFKLGVVARLAWSQRTVGRHRVMTHMNDIGPGGTPFGQEVRNLPFCVRIVARRSEEHTSELQSLMRISYAVFCLKKKKKHSTGNSKIIRLYHAVHN